jgi:N-acetylmuramoyl-L-alanine amidase
MTNPKSVVVSSGHGKHVSGAVGVMNEVTEARRVVKQLAIELKFRGVEVKTFNDDQSTSQNANLHAIVDYHNAQKRDLDISVHFNAFKPTAGPVGTECLYLTQKELAADVSDAIASVGFKDRGAKHRTDLFFLNQTHEPAILIEVCFVDSQADSELYNREFGHICERIANAITGGKDVDEEVEVA